MARENVFTLRIPSIGYEGSVAVKVTTRKCRIAFDVDSNDYKDGVFGFCEYSNSLKNKLKDSTKATALQAEFPPTGLQIEGDPYYSSWISMRSGQTITLKLDWEDKSLLQQYSTIAFDTHPDFSFSTTDLRDSTNQTKVLKQIQITCNATSTTPTRLEIKANNNIVVGVLNVFHPPAKEVKIRWFVVENNTGTSSTDLVEMTDLTKHNINLATLQLWFGNAFNPSLINVNFVNAQPIILDITTLPVGLLPHLQQKLTATQNQLQRLRTTAQEYENGTFKPLQEALQNNSAWTTDERREIQQRINDFQNKSYYKHILKNLVKNNIIANNQRRAVQMAQNKASIFSPNTTDQIARSRDREAFIELLKGIYALQPNAQLESDTVYLFLTYLRCETPNTTTSQSDEVQGFTYRQQNSCIMFTKNSRASGTFHKDMPHEVMHALGLEHTFETTAQHVFKDKQTDNYMDYDNTAKHTFVWQWRLLHESVLTN